MEATQVLNAPAFALSADEMPPLISLELQRCFVDLGYPLKAGHFMTSMTECDLVFSPPRLRQGLDVR